MTKVDLSKWAGWVVAVAAVAAAFGGAAVSLDEVEKDVVEIERAADAHKAEPAHHDTASRLDLVEERIIVLDEERRDLRQDVRDLQAGQTQIIRRLDALCVASPRCSIGRKPWRLKP